MKKKFTLLIAALALLTMMARPMTAFGQTGYDVIYTFSEHYSANTVLTDVDIPIVNGIITATFHKPSGTAPQYYTNGTAVRWYGGNTLEISATNAQITEIAFTITQGSNSVTASTGSYDNGTWTGSASNVLFTVGGSSGHIRVSAISINYTTSGGSLEQCDIALENDPVELEFDLYNNSEDQVIHYTTSSTGAITVANNDYIEVDIDEMAKTITVTPIAVTNGAKTITVNQAADDNYYAGSTTFTVNITNSAPSTGGDVTFNATEDKGTSPLVKNGVTFACSNGVLNNGSEYRLYKNSVTTFSVSEGTITQIVFTCTSGNPASGFATQTGWTTNGTNGTWTGNAQVVSFTASGAQVRATEIVVTVETSGTPDPTISADNVNIVYDATGGSIAYTINNEPSPAGTLTATVTDGNWLTLGQGTTSPISFTCTANDAAEARTATVTLTYTYNTDETVTKDVTITQAGNPNVFNNISDITEMNAQYHVKGMIVATSAKGFIICDGTGLVYTYLNAVPTQQMGDYVQITGTTGSYGHVIQFTSSATISEAETFDFEWPEITVITEVPDYTGSYHLSDYFQFEGTLTTSTGSNNTTYYNIAVGEGQIRISYPTTEQATDLNALLNKTVRIHGFFTGYSGSGDNTVFTAMMESYEEIMEPSVTVTPNVINAPAEGADGTLALTYDNITDFIAFDYYFCDANGEELQEVPNWITAEINEENNTYTLDYIIGANDGEARTAYIKVYTLDDEQEEVSAIVTINQAEYVAPTYAALPFSFNGGRDDIADTDGLYQDGLGTDYNASTNPTTKLKFDNTGDWLLLQFDEKPGTLTFDIKGNGFSGSTFKVQTSADGLTYTDLETYTDLGDTQSEEFNLAENIRYIKWIYTEKSSGNVGLGNIGLTAYVAPVPTVTVEATLIEAIAEGLEGNLAVTYANYDNPDDITPLVWFCDATGENDADYEWIDAEIDDKDVTNLYFIIGANTGDARTAYFKVYEASEDIFSELVTVTQEAYVAPVASITVDPALVEAPADETEGNLAITLENITISQVEDHFEVYFCDSEGTILGPNDDKPNWLIGEVQLEGGVFSLYYLIDENTDSEPRTAYMKVYGLSDDASTEAYSNLVTVTQAGLVVDYATLPFEWAGGSSADLQALAGVTTSTLSNDYAANNAPYLIKFDNNGKYIQVKTDSQPAKVTIGVKMIGGATTSYITVKASTDGDTFDDGEQLAISGNSGSIVNLETTRTFNADVRYVKMVFTKGSNVGVGPITITKYTTDPIINAEDVDLAYDATSGEIAYTITNPVAGKNLEATTSATWISNIAVSEEKVSFTTTANEGSEDRVATFTLTYEGAADKTVIVTQAHFVIDYATIPFAYDGNGTGELPVGLTPTGLGTYNSSPKMKFDGAGDNLILKLDAAPTSLSYDIKGNGSGSDSWAGTFKVQTSADGETYEDLVVYENNLGATQSITHINLASTVRYIKWVYVTKTTGNVALGNIHASDEYEIYGDMTINSDDLAAQPVIVHNGSVVTFVGTNTNAADLIIEDGGQLIHDGDGVQATIQKNITGYNNSRDAGNSNYQLIASPVATSLNVATQTNLISTTSEYDLYIFNENLPAKEWRNYKQTGEFTTIDNGKGYLYANASNDTISFAGALKSSDSDVTVNLEYTDGNRFAGWNLVGNPFACNAYAKDTIGKTLAFYKMNSTGNGFVAVTNGAIAPMEGVFVKASATGQSFAFTRQSPVSSPGKGNLIIQVAQAVTGRDAQHISDNAIIRFDGGNNHEKFSFNDNGDKLYFTLGNKDYSVFNAEARGEMPVNFKAAENGTYTIDFSMDNVEFSYLHLIDNKTGMDIDLLQTSSYTFEASKIDYASRFKLVFSTNNNSNSNDDNDFAFFDANGNLLILGNEGTATLQVIDITGRTVSNETFSGNYSKAINAKAGVYMLRLIQGNDVRTQKIVVR